MQFHPKFRLDGKAYSQDSLLVAAKKWQSSGDNEQKQLGMFMEEWLDGNDSLTLHTSGSTGTPKQLLVSKKSMQASAERTAAFFELSPGDTALLCLPTHYIAGKMMLVRALVIGLELDVIPSKSLLDLKGKTYDFAALIPLQVNASFDLLGNLKKILIGGAPIPTELRKALAKKYPHCVETYGMTETLTHVATRFVCYPTVPFRAMPGIKINVDHDSCLQIMAPYISSSPICTNDVVELLDNRSFILIGRRDFVINSGGRKIFPEQLEEKLSVQLRIPFFFTGIPDVELGEKLVLVVEGGIKEKQLGLKTATKLLGADKHLVPKDVLCLDTFVLTRTGKLNRIATLKGLAL
jgi:O-succinylbenzoic acid--CoA ligase